MLLKVLSALFCATTVFAAIPSLENIKSIETKYQTINLESTIEFEPLDFPALKQIEAFKFNAENVNAATTNEAFKFNADNISAANTSEAFKFNAADLNAAPTNEAFKFNVVDLNAVDTQTAIHFNNTEINTVNTQTMVNFNATPFQLADKVPELNTIRHSVFKTDYPELWDAELDFELDTVSISSKPIILPTKFHAVAPHPKLMIEQPELLKVKLLESKNRGVNVLIVPYRLEHDIKNSLDFILWGKEHFDMVILGFSANPPLPSPDEFRSTLDALLVNVDAIITAWVSSIDIAGVFDKSNEDTLQSETLFKISRLVDKQAKLRNVPSIGFRKIDVHGTWENPARQGGKSGGTFDYTPQGMSAYIYAHIQPFEYGLLVPPMSLINERINHQYPDKPYILGPFYYYGDVENRIKWDTFKRLVNMYKYKKFRVIEKWIALP